MTWTSAYFAAVTADHITPIDCSRCAGDAQLVQRLPAITGDGKANRASLCAQTVPANRDVYP